MKTVKQYFVNLDHGTLCSPQPGCDQAVVKAEELEQVVAERDALRLEAGTMNETFGMQEDKIDALQQRLTAADERVDALGSLVPEAELALKALNVAVSVYDVELADSARRGLRLIIAALKPAGGPAPTTCTWSSYEFSWASSCGMTGWEFTDGGTPGESGMKFCHCCGKTLVVEVPDPCACIGCEASKVSSSLFCAAHQSAKSRTRKHYPVTGERLEFMMQNDGYQQ